MHEHRQQTLRITTTTMRVSRLQLMLHHALLPYFHSPERRACAALLSEIGEEKKWDL